MIALYGPAILIALIILGLPIGFALGIAGVLSLSLIIPPAVISAQMSQIVLQTTSHYVLLTIPMFVLMAELLSAGGIAQDLMIACNRLLRRIRGGLAIACVLTGAILAAASGSSTASVASIARAAYPTMEKLGYDRSFSLGTISISGTLAILIPPSVAFVVYGLMTEEPIGKLFIAGLVPGLLTTIGYLVTIAYMIRRNPKLVPDNTVTDTPTLAQTGRVWPVVLLITLVMVCLYGGIATPTEVGALGAVGAGIIGMALGRLGWDASVAAIGNTLRTSAMIVTIIFGASLFGFFISYTQITNDLLTWIADSGMSRYAVLGLVVLIYLLLGMVMDQFAIIILTVPISHALITGLGFDGIWFGVIVVKTAEIGLVSPPLGLNVFIASAAAKVRPNYGFAGVMPFVVTEMIILAILLAFPALVIFLPNIL
ncbi:TRAP transporter large permease [Thalassovita taeanensis]|uniref:TRAP transporter large permease protein n=1 Tax=Thalassovita taeanensis TaxID=657014 RepID=A0A1H9BWI0_9RHOB|nr:TRAP transporter large permease [Thalassovita taeanensis]SEP93244.1 TRAP transporter, DctM subunit [Thalassovita taeanensis]